MDHEAALQSMNRPLVLESEERRKRSKDQHCMWESNGKTFPFLSLPPEVRHMVIHELLFVKTVSTPEQRTIQPRSKAKPPWSPEGILSSALGLLFSCRQVYEEARCVLYSRNRFLLFPRDILVPGFLDSIGHANRMAMATTISLLRVDVGDSGWSNFCALASEMPIRTLDVGACGHTSLESSIGSTWVKDLARIASLEKLFLSFIFAPPSFATSSYSGPCQPSQGFLDYLQEELERNKGKVLYQGRVELAPQRISCCGPRYVNRTDTFTAMESTPKLTLKVKYYRMVSHADNINNGRHYPHAN
ncbi:MAG: hypothetical protein M1840_002353 [Geoglossum simile]|nr:MAG: hypothetical protein M1840_002353 [Geoglossum simile]